MPPLYSTTWTPPSFNWVALGVLTGAFAGSGAASAAEKVELRLPTGQTVRADVVTMTKSEITIKLNDKEQSIPLALLSPREVFLCWQQIEKKDRTCAWPSGSI